MPLLLYNTFTKQKEEFIPVTAGEVKMYACGVTVYDVCHIGHARSLYIFDVIRRYLKYRKYNVTFVRNITDIDDKIINKAKELSLDAKEVAQKYTESYYKDLELLGIEKAEFEPKATEHIPEMVRHIKGLIEKDYAYAVEGDVYFRVKKFKDYGKLSGQSTDSMFEAVRIEEDLKKEDPLDFALWKKSKPGEPEYDSPWSKGRPGWHIECSVMSAKYLGETFDIHAGGMDLVFPHHENEIAQSEALTGKKFAKYWIHHGLLTINGQKMAKSLGNFVTIKDVLKKNPAEVLKICYLTVHYSKPLDFSWERMDMAREELERVRECVRKINYNIKQRKEYWIQSKPIIKEIDFIKKIDDFKVKFEDAMNDDFNTPQAKSVIFQIVTEVYIDNIRLENITCLEHAKQVIIDLGEVLGLSFGREDEIGSELVAMMEERNRAREAKDFKKADSIRKELEAKGIILEDTEGGKTIWRRK